MTRYIIAYGLRKPGRDYDELYRHLVNPLAEA